LKEAWVCLDVWSKEMVTTALESGADALVIPAGWQESVKALGRITTVGPDGDLKPGQDVFFEALHSPEDEARIARLLPLGPVVLEAGIPGLAEGAVQSPRERDWEVIPLENLLALNGRLFVPVYSTEEVDLALGILEKGVAGVVVHAGSPLELKALLKRVKSTTPAPSCRKEKAYWWEIPVPFSF
jgi:3-dehydroquinate synthase II